MRTLFRNTFAIGAVAIGMLACADNVPLAPTGATAPSLAVSSPLSGAIFTTNSACNGTNVNIFAAREDVYLDGGPTHAGAAGLPDGNYFARVTTPDGAVLGKTLAATVTVAGGEFVQCYQLSTILYSATSGFTALGYDETSNAGGEYKVWIGMTDAFTGPETKTDNFKVKTDGTGSQQGALDVIKFYDANANGINDDGQQIIGWKVNIADGISIDRYTPVSILLAADDYTVTEYMPVQANWYATKGGPFTVTVANGGSQTVEFGNVCTGAGGGLTLGFWSNKNGQALFGSDDLAQMVALNLRNANGTDFNPGNYAAFRTWILNATATNMAYMLSAQLAAMKLNVYNGNVNGGALIYAPGTLSANSAGFATVSAVVAEANTELGVHGLVLDGSPYRAYQEALKNALDRGNNNLNFVQATPCAFSF